MMMKLMNELKPIADKEYNRAVSQYGFPHSAHEGYAVVLEEFEEAGFELVALDDTLKQIWANTKGNGHSVHELETVERDALCLAAEAIQIYATARKFRVFEEVVWGDYERTESADYGNDSAREIKR